MKAGGVSEEKISTLILFFSQLALPLSSDFKVSFMERITLEYNNSDIQAQKTLEYILSLGIFKTAKSDKKETIAEKRKQLDDELKGYMADL